MSAQMWTDFFNARFFPVFVKFCYTEVLSMAHVIVNVCSFPHG